MFALLHICLHFFSYFVSMYLCTPVCCSYDCFILWFSFVCCFCKISFIFQTIRCRTCGIKFAKQSSNITLYEKQWEFLESIQQQYEIMDISKTIRILLDYVQVGRPVRTWTDAQKAAMINELEKKVFTIVRCNDPNCTQTH